jgi:hypothetical protein
MTQCFIFLLELSVAQISAISFSLFGCDRDSLMFFPAVQCQGEAVRAFWWIAVVGLVTAFALWPAITVFLYFYGVKCDPLFSDASSSSPVSFLQILHDMVFSGYRQDKRYFFWIHLLKRLSLVTVVLFMSKYPGMQVVAISGSLLFFFMLFIYTAPFERLITNILETVATFFTFFIILFAYGSENIPPDEQNKFSIALNGIYAGVLAIALIGLLILNLIVKWFSPKKEAKLNPSPSLSKL